ncbi:response regulator, partial [Bacteroidales bacterium MSK.15.36]|nr:response regulator [Bacteroidales bacterium MSK.15.36]
YMKILVVDDEKSIINLIRINLALEGYKVLEALNGRDAISIFKKEEPDLVLLDIMLPDLDGYEVLKELQNIDASKPIIFLTAKNQMNSKLLGLQLGAEDYITKPFDNRELVLRIRTIYRRINRYKISQKYEIDLDHNVLQHGSIKVLKNERKVFIENAEIRLTYKEFNMLSLMMKNYGRVFTREELLEKVWGYDFYGNSRAVDILITRLRDKMGNYKAYIQTVYIATIKILYLNLIKKSVEYLKSESYNSQIYVMDYIKRESDFKPNDVIKNMGPFIAQYIANNLKCTTQIYNNNLDLLGESKDSEGINYNEDVVAAVNGNKCYKIYKNFQKRYILFSSPIYSGDESIGCIRYIYDLEEDMLVVKKTIYSVFLVIISLTALSLILNNILSKEILSPIIKLKKASYNLKNGIFDKKIEIDTNDELYELGETFNEMSENLEVYIKTLKEEKEK